MNNIFLSAIRQISRAVRRIGKRRLSSSGSDLFYNNYVEIKVMYLHRFGSIPSIQFVNDIDSEKALPAIREQFEKNILEQYQRSYFDWQENKQVVTNTIIALANETLLELGTGYAEILFNQKEPKLVNELVSTLMTFKSEEEGEHRIHIIQELKYGLDLTPLPIDETELDINLYYNDDFAEVHQLIQTRLNKEKDKGIVLLHGLPGTGKTSYLRYLIGSLTKKVLFVSPSMASNMMSPEFLDLLIEHPDSVLVIEDAENIILDRNYRSNQSVSNLLNISDGLLSDCLNVQIICTFNSSLQLVDKALLRKGRLIAQYEFQRLSVQKAQELARVTGRAINVSKPMTLAEILNPASTHYDEPTTEIIGFRKVLATN